MAALWRPPSLRAEEHGGGSPAVSWTELFYDLVFVVAVANLGHRLFAAPSAGRAIEFVALFAMLWWAWASVTFLVDRFESNDAFDRLLAVAQMLGVAAFAATVAADADLGAIGVGIAASYSVTRLVLLAMYARVWWHLEESRPLVGGYLRGFGVDTVLWVASIAVPAPARYGMWGLAMVISLATPWLMRRTQVRSPLSASHLPERFGLFTILVLGESVAAVVAGLHAEHVSGSSFAAAAASLMVATGLWWVYFDNFEGSVVRRDPDRRHDWRPTAWIYGHFPLAMCLATVGNGMAHLITHGVTGDEAHDAYFLMVTCSVALAAALLAMALILVSTAGGDLFARRRRAIARLIGAVVVLMLAVVSARLEPVQYLEALALIMVIEVLFDVVDGARA